MPGGSGFASTPDDRPLDLTAALTEVWCFRAQECCHGLSVLAYDHSGKGREREDAGAEHRAYPASFGKRLLASAALLGDDGQTIAGGASLLDRQSNEEAVRFEAEAP
ncbi:YciI family protein [Algihabitans albus]|uniref:hypothetical protein n=1 Tax=Algihabitans albus TaxID=2164067 RepID=UPI000E5C8B32|nr:hypothetical protein [Algihabitans albus]